MFDKFLGHVTTMWNAVPFSAATWSVILTLAFFVWLFSKASRDPNSPIRWEHLIVDSRTDRADPYKLSFLLGTIVGTWIVVNFADKDKLTFDIFGMYLTYLLGGAGWISTIKSKNPTAHDPQVTEPTPPTLPEEEPKDPTKQ